MQPSPLLYSADLAPVPASARAWTAWDMASLWIGLVVSVSSWWAAGRCLSCLVGSSSWQQLRRSGAALARLLLHRPAWRRFLAGGLVELGMSAWQGVACVFVANAIVLAPMVMLGHAGVKYG